MKRLLFLSSIGFLLASSSALWAYTCPVLSVPSFPNKYLPLQVSGFNPSNMGGVDCLYTPSDFQSYIKQIYSHYGPAVVYTNQSGCTIQLSGQAMGIFAGVLYNGACYFTVEQVNQVLTGFSLPPLG